MKGWTTRGLGAPHATVDPHVKLSTLAEIWEERAWSAVGLSDVRWIQDELCYKSGLGVRRFKAKKGWWTIVHHGLVAVAMDEATTREWRRGGAVGKGWKGGQKSSLIRIGLPRRGWRRGRSIVSVYVTPTGSMIN